MARHQGRVQCSERALAARVTPRGRADPVRIERDAPMRRSVLVPHATDVLALGADAEKASGLDRAEVGEAGCNCDYWSQVAAASAGLM